MIVALTVCREFVVLRGLLTRLLRRNDTIVRVEHLLSWHVLLLWHLRLSGYLSIDINGINLSILMMHLVLKLRCPRADQRIRVNRSALNRHRLGKILRRRDC